MEKDNLLLKVAVVMTLFLTVLEIGEVLSIGFWVFLPIMIAFASELLLFIVLFIIALIELTLDKQAKKRYNNNDREE